MKMRSTIILFVLLALLALPWMSIGAQDNIPYEPVTPTKIGRGLQYMNRATTPDNTSTDGTIALPDAPDSTSSSDLNAVAPRAVPANDDFANATVINSIPFSATVNTFEDATLEIEEVEPSCVGDPNSSHSVWFTYTPTTNKTVNVDLTDSNFDTILTVYTGATLAGLSEYDCNDDVSIDIYLGSRLVALDLFADTQYYFRVTNFFLVTDPPQPPLSNATLDFFMQDTGDPINVNINTFNDTIDANVRDNTCSDGNGQCSLRAAVMQANYVKPGSTINIPAGTLTYTVAPDPQVGDDDSATVGDIDVTQDMTITGAAANQTTINAAGVSRVLEVLNDATATISGMTVTGGNVIGDGAGIRVKQQGTLLILNDALVINNTTAGSGGGIDISNATLSLNNSSVIDNSAGFNGGGIHLRPKLQDGVPALVSVTNLTVSGNSTTGDPAFSGNGGGVQVSNEGNFIGRHVTIASNTATGKGGGLNIENANSTASISTTLVALNTATSGADCFGTINAASDPSKINLIGNSADCVPGDNDIFDVDAKIAETAASNGPGTTYTQAILPDSPAFNATACDSNGDQRGVPRPQGASCDIGAFELVGGSPAAFTLSSPVNNTVYLDSSTPDAFSWTASTGAFNYRLTITQISGINAGLEVYNSGPLNGIEICSGNTCGIDYGQPLPDAAYRWNVEALGDATGVFADPFRFTVGVPIIDLIYNGGFEEKRAGKQPVGWKNKRSTKDKIKCNKDKDGDGIDDKIFSLEGDCAYRFKGSATEKSKLIQAPDVSNTLAEAGDVITLLYNIKAGDTAKGKVVYKIFFDDSTKDKIVHDFVATDGYEEKVANMPVTGSFNKIKVVIKNRSTSGKVYFDAISMLSPGLAEGAVAAQQLPEAADAIPLPEAPDGFNRAN